ncbi:peptidoglycan-binding protein [Enterococcus sp.]|uniref:peptidoglycan-binding protein n=1 Tax=Enterococcus sp. TaxID=35783 RepID=UPI0028995922|nr:peptidoglycan-binding protein [Enterococcus sp.]
MKKGYLTGLVTLSAVLLMGCAADGASDASSDTTVETETSDSVVSDKEADEDVTITTANGANAKAEIPADDTVYMRQLYAAPHGEKSVAVVTVMMRGDTILSAEIDEFQYLAASDEWTGVVNSDKKFGENYNDGQLLISKQENDEAYSDLMADRGDSTVTWGNNIQAITDFAVGKTTEELKETTEELADEAAEISDVVSGATFVDTKGYLEAIIEAAESGTVSAGMKTDSDSFTQAQLIAAPHGEQSFAVVTVAMTDETIAAVFMDELQFLGADSYAGVPNSDLGFGEGAVSGQVLASKLANDEAYSDLMKANRDATYTWSENIQAIQSAAIGSTIAEVEALIAELSGQSDDDSPEDVVSGATFVDTAGYLQAIVDAAAQAK